VDHKWSKKTFGAACVAKKTLPRIRIREQEHPRFSKRHCSPATMTLLVESIRSDFSAPGWHLVLRDLQKSVSSKRKWIPD
jgi:hypothetical protein